MKQQLIYTTMTFDHTCTTCGTMFESPKCECLLCGTDTVVDKATADKLADLEQQAQTQHELSAY